MNKKGISPLIATVLLVGFTIVLAVVVVNWARNLTEGITSDVSCETEANSLCRNMPTIPVVLSNVNPNNRTRIVISNIFDKDLDFLLIMRDSQDNVLESAQRNVSANAIYDSALTIPIMSLFNTYYSGNKLQYTILLPYTDSEGNTCKVTCKEEEITIK
ncbi:MAG: archaellin/type IV pilin N-terminal domain-containing protein [Nanoarchaeota archaeon]